MKKYLALTAIVFASQACAMETSTKNQPDANRATESSNPLNQLSDEVISALKKQGNSDTEILAFVLTLKKIKDSGLTDRQILQRLESLTGKGFVRTNRRNNNRQTKIIAGLTFLGGAGIVALIAWYLINQKKTEITEQTALANKFKQLLKLIGYDDTNEGHLAYGARLKTEFDAKVEHSKIPTDTGANTKALKDASVNLARECKTFAEQPGNIWVTGQTVATAFPNVDDATV